MLNVRALFPFVCVTKLLPCSNNTAFLSANASLMETQFNFHNYHKEKEKLLRAIHILFLRVSIWELWLKISCAWQVAIATNFLVKRKREKKGNEIFFIIIIYVQQIEIPDVTSTELLLLLLLSERNRYMKNISLVGDREMKYFCNEFLNVLWHNSFNFLNCPHTSLQTPLEKSQIAFPACS